MSEESTEVSHDDNAASSTAQEAEIKPEVTPEGEVEVEASAPEKKPENKNRFQKRINELTTKNFESEQRAKALEARLKDLESKAATVEPVKAPTFDDFANEADYDLAKSNYIAENAANTAYERISRENKANQDYNAQVAAQQTLVDKKKGFDENLADKAENFEDFDEVAYGHQFIHDDSVGLIYESEKGPELAYHLGSNLDLAEKIFMMTPTQRARELTKIEFGLEALTPKKVSDAPNPIKPLGNQEKIGIEEDDMSDDEWLAFRYKQLNAQRGTPQ